VNASDWPELINYESQGWLSEFALVC